MKSGSHSRGRAREVAVLVAGSASCAALLWAGATVHGRLRTEGEVAVARVAGEAADTVVAEWERILRAREPPVPSAGEVFWWTTNELHAPRLWLPATAPLAPAVDPPSAYVWAESPSMPTTATFALWSCDEFEVVFDTRLEEAERRELEGDLPGALELVREALAKETNPRRLARSWLWELQLRARLERRDIVEEDWERLRRMASEEWVIHRLSVDERRCGLDVRTRLLAWLALAPEMQAAEPGRSLVTLEEVERLFLSEDRLTPGTPEQPERFELSPTLALLLERMNLELPSLERRKLLSFHRTESLPTKNVVEHRWLCTEVGRYPFFLRRDGHQLTGFFYAADALKEAVRSRSGLPLGFHLDLEGDDDSLGLAVRPRTDLPDSPHAFTLRHSDPDRIAREASSRLALQRIALIGLAFACASGGWLTARVLARERELADLRSAFIAGVSHDLRTPLASILLLAENLESGAAEASGRPRYHAALRKEAMRLRRLIDGVLDFSRLERGQGPRIERESVELGRLLDELEVDCRTRVEEVGRAFTCARAPLPARGSLDAHAVRRAVDNLLDNALKHGHGAVRLACSASDGRLRLSIADDGPGVAPGDRERIFEPFERLHASEGHGGGSGLGLAIVRAIARAHGGEARVRADGAGVGSVFELDFLLEDPGA